MPDSQRVYTKWACVILSLNLQPREWHALAMNEPIQLVLAMCVQCKSMTTLYKGKSAQKDD